MNIWLGARMSKGDLLSRYPVFDGTTCIGYVESVHGHSYRGMQGWNRGVRIRDYRPKTWRYEIKGQMPCRCSYVTRRQAVEQLAKAIQPPKDDQ